MLDRAALLQDGVPRLLAVLGLGDQQLFQIGVADDEAARQRLVRIDVGGDRLDAGGSAAADDRDRRRRRNRHLAREAFHHAHVGRVGARAALLRKHHRGFVHLSVAVLDDLQVPALGHRSFKREAASTAEAVEPYHANADGAISIWHEKRSITPMSAASGHGPRSCASIIEASFTLSLMCLKTFRFQLLAIALSNGMPRAWRKLWKPITPRPTERSRDALYLARAISSGARSI